MSHGHHPVLVFVFLNLESCPKLPAMTAVARPSVCLLKFLPALLLCEGWALHAELVWGPERREAGFDLSSDDKLRSHYPDKGVWITEEEKHFVARLAATKTPWVAEKKSEISARAAMPVASSSLRKRNPAVRFIALAATQPRER